MLAESVIKYREIGGSGHAVKWQRDIVQTVHIVEHWEKRNLLIVLGRRRWRVIEEIAVHVRLSPSLPFSDKALDLIQPTVGARYSTLNYIAADFAAPTAVTCL